MYIKVRRFLSRFYAWILGLYDQLFSREVDICLADFMLNRGYVDSLQFLLASRIIDVEEFDKGNENFIYTNRISKAAYPERDNSFFLETNKVFANLINNIKEFGFDKRYPIKLDSEYRITDGTHRIAVCYHEEIINIRARILRRKSPNKKSPISYYSKCCLHTPLLNSIVDKNDAIQKRLIDNGYCFCLYATGGEEIANDMRVLTSVKEILVSDDRLLLKFVMNDPDYCVLNGQVVSKKAVNIEQIIRDRHQPSSLEVSKNCSEGHVIYENHKLSFLQGL